MLTVPLTEPLLPEPELLQAASRPGTVATVSAPKVPLSIVRRLIAADRAGRSRSIAPPSAGVDHAEPLSAPATRPNMFEREPPEVPKAKTPYAQMSTLSDGL